MSIELSAEHPHAVPSADAADAASHRVAMPPPVALPEDTDAPAGSTAAQAQADDTSTAGQGEVAAAAAPPRIPLRRHSITFDGLLASPIDSLPFPEFRSSVAFKLVLVFLIALPFWVVPTNRLQAASKNTAPIYLTLAWYFIVSWLLGRLVAALRGPPAFGYLISGFILSFCVDDVWLAAKPYVQNLAFLIVLVRAGLEISPHDLRASTVALGTLPYVADAVAVAAYAVWLQYSIVRFIFWTS
jgi:hypothetical protein